MESLKETILNRTADTLTSDLREEIVTKVTDRVLLSQVREIRVWHVFQVSYVMELLANHKYYQGDNFQAIIGVLGPKTVYKKYYVGVCDDYLDQYLLEQVEDDEVLIEINPFLAEAAKDNFLCNFDFDKCKGQVVMGVGRKNQ